MVSSKRLPTLSYALLGLINRQPASGYELMQIFKVTPLGGYSSSPGAIYPALKKVRIAGFIEPEDQEVPSRGQRWQTTLPGREALTAWLVKPVEGDVMDLSEAMLKFTFQEEVLSFDERYSFLKVLTARLAQQLDSLQAIETRHADQMRLHDRLSLKAGIMDLQSSLDWARLAITEIKAAHKEKI